jgi:hypothetical protein
MEAMPINSRPAHGRRLPVTRPLVSTPSEGHDAYRHAL